MTKSAKKSASSRPNGSPPGGKSRNATRKAKTAKFAKATASQLPGKAAKAPANKDTTTPRRPDSTTKQSRVLAMLQSGSGATIAAMMQATGWQQHSVRGFLAGVVRKRLKLKTTSQKVDGNRVYQIETARDADMDSRSRLRAA